MPYNPQTWHDSPATDTPISAARLGVIETGLQTAQATGEAAAAKSANLSDLASASSARTNLGLGTVATHAATEFATQGAHVFRVDDYGALGNGKIISDLVLNSTTTATSASAAFTSGDTGKTILINGGQGTTSLPLVTTITFVNSTTVTLGSAASVTGTGFVAVYGTDDTAAINTCISAASTYAQANNYAANVTFSAKIYMLTSGPTQTGNGSTTPTFNAQIPIPYPAAAGTSRKLVIELTGAADAGFVQYWMSTTPNIAGTALVSTLTAPTTPDATFGIQSVIGGPTGGAGYGGTFANVKVVVRNLQVVCGVYTNLYAYDFGYCAAMRVQQSGAAVFAPSGVNGGNSPLQKDLIGQAGFQNKIGAGLRSPVVGNNADSVIDDFTVSGFSRGLYLFDHLTAGRIFTFYNDVACKIDLTQGTSGVSHGISVALWAAEVYNGGISVTGGGGGFVQLLINWDAECPGVTYDLSDAGPSARGIVRWCDPADARNPVVSGGGNVKFINDKLAPGAWSGQPAVPSSTVAQQNTSWRDAAVSIKGGTVTVVAVDGVTCATATGTTVIVPSGKNITLTYSVAPTWAWTLL